MANNIDRPNAPDAAKIKDMFRRIDGILSEQLSEKGAFLKKNAVFKSRIDDILEEAKAAGIPKKVMNVELKIRKNLSENEGLRAGLEDDQVETLQTVEEALASIADLPLGQAAIAAHNKATVGTAGKTTVEKAPKTAGKQDDATAAIVGAVLATEPAEGEKPKEEGDKNDEEEKRKIAEQRDRDAAEFETKPPVTVGENVTRLDPSAARRNRAGAGKTKSEQAAASEAAKAAEATSAQREKGTPEGVKIAGAEPGAIKF